MSSKQFQMSRYHRHHIVIKNLNCPQCGNTSKFEYLSVIYLYSHIRRYGRRILQLLAAQHYNMGHANAMVWYGHYVRGAHAKREWFWQNVTRYKHLFNRAQALYFNKKDKNLKKTSKNLNLIFCFIYFFKCIPQTRSYKYVYFSVLLESYNLGTRTVPCGTPSMLAYQYKYLDKLKSHH